MKTTKIILAGILIIFSVAVATRLGDDVVSVPKEDVAKTTVYYVPVTGYFSNLVNVTADSFTGKKIFVTSSDKDNIARLLGDKIDYVVIDKADIKNSIGESGIAIIRWDRVTPNLKTLSYEGKYLWDKDDVSGYELKTEVSLASSESQKAFFDPQKLTKINFLGDIMLSRHVNTQMERLGFDYPWQKVKGQISDADITFANLEVPISDMFDAPAEGMSFIAPTKNLEYLKAAGIDIVSVANNHTANFGYKVFIDNLNNLKKAGIKVCGGGLTEVAAREATSLEKNGTGFGFLCQSAITGSLYAKGKDAGVPYLGIEPWYRQDKSSLANMVADIKKAEAQDVLITSPHWGIEYKQYPNADQQKVARMMIDSGADLVIGTHPHVVQSLEFYKEKYVTYSLGNFIFDQEWSTETKQGVMASAYFYGTKNMAVGLVPLQIENYAQPRFVTGATATKIIGDIKKSSKGF